MRYYDHYDEDSQEEVESMDSFYDILETMIVPTKEEVHRSLKSISIQNYYQISGVASLGDYIVDNDEISDIQDNGTLYNYFDVPIDDDFEHKRFLWRQEVVGITQYRGQDDYYLYDPPPKDIISKTLMLHEEAIGDDVRDITANNNDAEVVVENVPNTMDISVPTIPTSCSLKVVDEHEDPTLMHSYEEVEHTDFVFGGIWYHIEVDIKDDGRLKAKNGSHQAKLKSKMKLKSWCRVAGREKEVNKTVDRGTMRYYDHYDEDSQEEVESMDSFYDILETMIVPTKEEVHRSLKSISIQNYYQISGVASLGDYIVDNDEISDIQDDGTLYNYFDVPIDDDFEHKRFLWRQEVLGITQYRGQDDYYLYDPPPKDIISKTLMLHEEAIGDDVRDITANNNDAEVVVENVPNTMDISVPTIPTSCSLKVVDEHEDPTLMHSYEEVEHTDFVFGDKLPIEAVGGIWYHIEVDIKDDGRLKAKNGSHQAKLKSKMKLKSWCRVAGREKEVNKTVDRGSSTFLSPDTKADAEP
ncbi:OLC1v1015713C1 [Oldenlandia corymbosa var. corymbosa]|uniref:OLC1v1015713C1 n=1 Tax=Oldenlandia corymbosa var. corymbosa TaxID=529605 RepID=A0AAV1E434_OLDCO|nr:OLC1v1015713C1 [Oldenlandia corymbosa var. corymbosa]